MSLIAKKKKKPEASFKTVPILRSKTETLEGPQLINVT